MSDVLQIPFDHACGTLKWNPAGDCTIPATGFGSLDIGEEHGVAAEHQEILFPFINKDGGESSIGRRKYF
ncbi:hypothetical protein [Labrys okinawensis]|uniref:hypothetical protein n=1 Tax=Labrys okinawensis TaxID=346911 RepID=UPI0015E3C8A9|nr:hypothetical protein [Labrys okinawensis]